MGESDMHRNADNDVEQENESTLKGGQIKRQEVQRRKRVQYIRDQGGLPVGKVVGATPRKARQLSLQS